MDNIYSAKTAMEDGRKMKHGILHSLREFSQSTTLHGVRYVSETHAPWSRRLLWIVFVLLCLIAVIYQIVDRVGHYYSWPHNVNVKINYNQTLNFPAVTICNQNSFRTTETATLGRYRLMEQMFAKSDNITMEDLQRYHASNISLRDLYIDSAHRKQDMIIDCLWKNEVCTYEDFEMILTDHGVCYMFYRNATDMQVSSSGVDSGLRLTLNVEQYEYMTGPHDAAGIKILLHDPRQMPFVYELGQAVPTGGHAFFGVKYMKIDNLPKPYGECDAKELRHTDYFSTEECFVDCLVKLQESVCGCRDMYMPHFNGSPPVCTLKQYYSCLKDLEEEFERSLRMECDCPVPCYFDIYESSISYGSMSNYLVNKLLTSNESKNLQQRLESALEVTAKMNDDIFRRFKDLSKNYLTDYRKVKEVVNKIANSIKAQTQKTTSLKEEMRGMFQTKERIYRYQLYAVEKNFVRAYTAMNERTLENVATSHVEFALLNKRRIRRLANDDTMSDDNRRSLYEFVVDSLQTRNEIVEMAQQNWTQLISSYISGIPIFNYKFEKVPRKHNLYIVPKPLMNYSMHHNHYMLKYVPEIQAYNINRLTRGLQMFVQQATIAYENRTINESSLEYVYEQFSHACRNYLQAKSVVYSLGIVRPLKVLKQRKSDFENLWTSFDTGLEECMQNSESLNDLTVNITTNIIPVLDNIGSTLHTYSQQGGGNLMEIAVLLKSNNTTNSMTILKNFFREVHIRGQLIDDLISLAIKPVHAMLTMIINDEDSIDYYNYTNNDLFLRDLAELKTEWTQKVTEIKAFAVQQQVMDKNENYFASLDKLRHHLHDFELSLTVDNSFLKQNFLQLDIFYRQLSYEYVYQQKAYDIFALVCDIGGAMGLFIGASIMTILEVIDLLLIELPIVAHKTRTTKTSTYAS